MNRPCGRRLFLLLAICSFTFHSGAAGVRDETKRPGDGCPAGWSRSGGSRLFQQEDLFNYIDGGAELFLEFGFRQLQVQSYNRGDEKITVEVYEMQRPASALAIYLQRRGQEIPLPGIEARHTGDRYQITALKGRFFFQALNGSGNEENLPALTALIRSLSEGMAEESEPTPLDLLPAENRVPGSELLLRGHYSLQNLFTFGEGDILSLGDKLWAAAADYISTDGSSSTLIIAAYPDAGTAGAAFAYLARNLDPLLKVLERDGERLVFIDYSKRYGIVRLKGDRLEIRIRLEKPWQQ